MNSISLGHSFYSRALCLLLLLQTIDEHVSCLSTHGFITFANFKWTNRYFKMLLTWKRTWLPATWDGEENKICCGRYMYHRTIELSCLEETFKSLSPTINLTLPIPPLNHVPKLRIYTSFKYLQCWCLNHFPGQPVPMLDNSFSEEIFPNIQSKPLLVQLQAISPRPIAWYLREKTDMYLYSTHVYMCIYMEKKKS